MTITGSETDSDLITSVKGAVEALSAIGTGNAVVTGTRTGGFKIELSGSKAGQDLSGLIVTTALPTVTTSVVTVGTPTTAINETDVIIIDASLKASGTYRLQVQLPAENRAAAQLEEQP